MEKTFEQWLVLVDREVTRHTGCSVYDLADCTFRDWYNDDMSPVTAARKAIEAN